ncbi:hepatocyte growth factor activator isoform X2 [Boleophthalmus pectinirostris]|uniref:hepatocyte growth factor activator isoform X2 n=1 Tax=Boleophthalmus pectinirostris TaxID=150288 RepID=UPI000A1C28F2|nr:hepatocyte growth factor activator isoform X2 [Boleophthalmus pectinirostris]
MLYVTLLLLSYVMNAHARLLTSSLKEAPDPSSKVFTTTGKQCKFPFRQGGRIHHHCITVLSSRPWCSLTHNFDRDRKFGFCVQERQKPGVGLPGPRRNLSPCLSGPCQNGGMCSVIQRQEFDCTCPESHSGRLCEQKKCYETVHLHYYDTGESWGRIHLRNVEQCTCVAGEIRCEKVHYTACQSNPCQNEGLCRLITSTGKEVCYCQRGYSGPDCSLEPRNECYNRRGTSYRGLGGTTLSGAHCLPWDSDLLFNELHVGNVDSSPLKGLGGHAYCRNPDGDKKPWCYTLNDGAISWEYCNVPSCLQPVWKTHPAANLQMFDKAFSRGITRIITNRKTKKAQCGTKHKKRLSIARGRIMGGTSALPGTHPWMAAIYIGHTEFCAGNLIASCWVVSAAHCFFRNPLISQIRVVLGQHRFNVTDSNTKTFSVEKYIFPKKFSVFNPTVHDIVLLKLKKQDGRCVRKTPFIRPICLPDKGMTFPDEYCCSISGWGHIREKAEGYTGLQEAMVRLIPHEVCRKPQIYGNHVTPDMICAGLNGCADACQGDSGGPLACAKGDVSFLYGIISWADGCGRKDKPGVYTRVVNYIDWIDSVIGRKTNN